MLIDGNLRHSVWVHKFRDSREKELLKLGCRKTQQVCASLGRRAAGVNYPLCVVTGPLVPTSPAPLYTPNHHPRMPATTQDPRGKELGRNGRWVELRNTWKNAPQSNFSFLRDFYPPTLKFLSDLPSNILLYLKFLFCFVGGVSYLISWSYCSLMFCIALWMCSWTYHLKETRLGVLCVDVVRAPPCNQL